MRISYPNEISYFIPSQSRKTMAYYKCRGLFVLLISIFFCQFSVAQNMTTVVIPSSVTKYGDGQSSSDNIYNISGGIINGQRVPTDYVKFEFDLSTVPVGARVNSWTTRIYLQYQGNPSSDQFVRLLLSENSEDAVASVFVDQSMINKGVNFEVENESVVEKETWLENQGGSLSVWLKADTENYTYYSLPPTNDNNVNLQPKLIISYYMPTMIAEGNWPQHKSNPQHSGQSLWKSNATLTEFKTGTTSFGSSFIMEAPVIYNQLLVFPYQDSQGPLYSVRAYTEDGDLVMENSDINEVVNFQPVMDQNGRLYIITNGTNLQILNLADELNLIDKRTLKAQVSATPVVGYDGSLYFSTSSGIYAYTPYSASTGFTLKWLYKEGGNDFGSVALNENENTVYVMNGETGKLRSLDITDGTKNWAAGEFLGYNEDIPVPLVRNNSIIMLDGAQSGKMFSIINSSGEVILDPKSNDISYSVPVIGTELAYIIDNGELTAYDLAHAKLTYQSKNQNLNPASSLVVDGDDNVYILSYLQDNQSITLYDKECNMITKKDLNGFNDMTDGHFIIAPDGNLFTDSGGELYCISPMSVDVDSKTISANAKNQFVYRANTEIIVEGITVPQSTNTIIYSGGRISFAKGFTVQNNAKLTCKVGY